MAQPYRPAAVNNLLNISFTGVTNEINIKHCFHSSSYLVDLWIQTRENMYAKWLEMKRAITFRLHFRDQPEPKQEPEQSVWVCVCASTINSLTQQQKYNEMINGMKERAKYSILLLLQIFYRCSYGHKLFINAVRWNVFLIHYNDIFFCLFFVLSLLNQLELSVFNM